MEKTKKKLLIVLLSFVMALMCFSAFNVLYKTNTVKADTEPQILSVASVEWVGFENGNAAVGLYRLKLNENMPSAASNTAATPRSTAVQYKGSAAADIKGENTTNTLIIRMLYGLVKSGATSIANLDNGTVVLLKAGVPFTLNNGTFAFDKDYEFTYTAGDSVLRMVVPAKTLSIKSVAFDTNESAAVGLYNITLNENVNSFASVTTATSATPNTVIQKSDGNSAADIRGKSSATTLQIRVPYGRVQAGATSISDLTQGTMITIKAGVEFTFGSGTYKFDEDYVMIYDGGTSFKKYVPATNISVSSISFIGLEGGNAAIGLYRVTLTSAMEGPANTTAATPRGAVQLENGTAVADIRGENTNNTLIVRMLYSLINSATAITDIEKGTKVILKAGVPFTLNNGKYQFSEDVELVYDGGTSFEKYVPATDISVSSISFIGLEGGNAAIGLYRVTLTSAMEGPANTTAASPRGAVQLENGTAVADIRGEGTNNTLIIRMLYGLVKANATSITDIEKGTKVVLKAGVPFTLNNGKYQFSEDVELTYEDFNDRFSLPIVATTVSVESFEFVGLESGNTAIGLYRINLGSDMNSAAGPTYATATVVQKSDSNSAADIKGENTVNSLIMRVPYGRVQTGATKLSDIADGTVIKIKAGVKFTFDNVNYYVFNEDYELEASHAKDCFITKQEKTYTEIKVTGIVYNNAESTAIDIYKLSLSSTVIASVGGFAYLPTGFGLELPDGSKAGYLKGNGNQDYILLRVCYGFFDSSATGKKATKSAEIDNEQGLIVKGGENFTFDGVNYFYFDKDYTFYFAQSDKLFHYVKTDVEVSVLEATYLRDVSNPLASDYVLDFGNSIKYDANVQIIAPFNGGAQGVLRKKDNSTHVGYAFAEGNEGKIFIRIYGSGVGCSTSMDELVDGTTVLVPGNVKFTFTGDGENYFHFDADYYFVYNKYMNLWYATKMIDSDYYAYNSESSSWEKINPVIYITFADSKVSKTISTANSDEITIIAGSDVSTLMAKGYDLLSMYNNATFDVSSAINNDKFVAGSYEITFNFEDAMGISVEKVVTVLVDDCVYVNYHYEDDSIVYDYAKLNENYVLGGYTFNYSNNIFVGWRYNGGLYFTGDTLSDVQGEIDLYAVVLDFTMADGASIRISDSIETSGIRFLSLLKKVDYDNLMTYAKAVSYGTLILPFDYLELNQYPNLEDFTPDVNILKIDSTVSTIKSGYINYYGGIVSVFEKNYARSFAGRAYIEITYFDDTVRTFYNEFNEENIRSVKYVALMAKEDTETFSTYSQDKQDIISGYIKKDVVNLMNYAKYSTDKYKVLNLDKLPDLSPVNHYDNAYNRGIVNDIKDAGFNVVTLSFLYPTTKGSIASIKEVINLFYEYGIKSIVFAGNHSDNSVNFEVSELEDFPDFSDCEGFLGFYVWDEGTTSAQFEAMVDYAKMFKSVYGIKRDVKYINDVGYAYLDEYCEQVLANLPEGVDKYLSTYSYPIKNDHTLEPYFLSNLVTLKLLSIRYGAESNIIIQSSSWPNDSHGARDLIPSYKELRLQVYAALAFGIDDISFFTYAPLNGEGADTAPVDRNGKKNDSYVDLKNIAGEVNAIDQILAWYKWRGVILNIASGSNDEVSYNNAINGYKPIIDKVSTDVGSEPLGDYSLDVTDTVLLSSISSDSNLNFLMGVFIDNNGNEAYLLSNYNDLSKNRTQKITINFNENVSKVLVYRAGVEEEISVTGNSLSLTLYGGEGLLIIPSKIG